jgi:cell division protein FtsB
VSLLEKLKARLPRRRLLLGLLCTALSVFTARSILGERGLLEALGQRGELVRIRREVEAARARNAALAAEIAKLRKAKENTAIESIAREKLGYIKPGEVTYLFPEESSDPPPAPAKR